MQDISTIAALGSFIIIFLGAVWGIYRYYKKRDLMVYNEESEHNWQSGRGEFIVRFAVENNQQREVTMNSVRLFRNRVEMQVAPFSFEIEPTIRLNSGERREFTYRFIEPEGRSLGLSRRILVRLVVEWNGSSTSRELESKLQGSY